MGTWKWRLPTVAWLGLMAGCSLHGARVEDFPGPTVRTGWASAGIADRRAEFQPVFCRHHAASNEGACERWLATPVGAGGVPAGIDRRPPLPARRALVVVPGIFGECVAKWVTPFSADHADLGRLGYDVIVVPVEGRASSALNAKTIHATFASYRELLKDAVVIAYSKGVTDFMLAATQPEAAEWLPDVSVLVSVAGTANGSPLANRGEKTYRSVLADLPWESCGPSDGGGVSSITYLAAMPVADEFARRKLDIETFSVVAITHPDSVNPVLAPFARYLDGMDRRNDGQVLAEDAIVPGSQVLGMFRADHWSIALPFAESDDWQVAALKHNNAFPRGALIRALLEFTAPVAASLSAPTRQVQEESP